MNTHGREDSARILCRKLQHFLAGLQTHTRFNEITDIGILHLLYQLGEFPFFEGISVLVI